MLNLNSGIICIHIYVCVDIHNNEINTLYMLKLTFYIHENITCIKFKRRVYGYK